MGKFLIPMWYYESGYSGTVSGLSLSMSGESDGYEVYKGFSTDDREYLKYTGYVVMTNPYVSSGTQGAVVVSNHLLSSTSNKLYLQKDDNSGFTSPTTKIISAVYGDGVADGTGSYLYAGGSPITGTTKSLIIYSGDTEYQYYRFWVDPTNNQRLQILTHGIVYDTPDNYRIEEKTFNYKYHNSMVYDNLLGNVYYDGLQNNGIKKTHELNFEYVNNTDKGQLLSIFQLGKGGLPVWFLDDLTDNETWMYCGINSMKISEPYAGYFTINLNLMEY